MNGKEKCRILKEIRRQIAEQNDIEWIVSECKHQGECKGTCPKCESEVRKLEHELERRRVLGKTAVVAGVSAMLMTGLSGCAVVDRVEQIVDDVIHIGQPKGDVPIEYPIEGEIVDGPENEMGEVEALPGDEAGSSGEDEIYELAGDVAEFEDGE